MPIYLRVLCLILLLCTTAVWAVSQDGWQISKTVKQGQVVMISGQDVPINTNQRLQVSGLGRIIPLYAISDGHWEGFLPISVSETPGSHTVDILDAHGHRLTTETLMVEDAHFPIQNIIVNSHTKGLEPLPGEMETVQALKTRQTAVKFWQEPFISPTQDCENSPFGVLRYHNGKPTGDYHKGVDLRSPQGRLVRATNDGIIVISRAFRLHGGTVGIDHGQGFTSIYIHLSKRLVVEGQRVKAGEAIGLVGSTGFATGPHLHWGLYVNGLPVNPDQWLSSVNRC